MTSDERLELYDNFIELVEKINETHIIYNGQTGKWLLDLATIDKIKICENKLKNFWRTGK